VVFVMEDKDLHFVDSVACYNLIQDSAQGKLLVDVRDTAAFEAGCIRGAILLCLPETVDDVKQLVEAKVLKYSWDDKDCKLKEVKEWNHRGLLYKFVVIYDDVGGNRAKVVAQLVSKEGKVKPENVLILQGGYDGFHKEYELVCSSLSQKKKAMEGALPSEIVPKFIYLGSNENARNKEQLNKLGITHVVNAAAELENAFPNDFSYKKLSVDDTSRDDIAQFFAQVVSFIDAARSENKNARVFVHCAMGISRSPTVVIAWLMKSNNWDLETSKNFVKQLRSTIKPNAGFMEQLGKYEREILHHTKS